MKKLYILVLLLSLTVIGCVKGKTNSSSLDDGKKVKQEVAQVKSQQELEKDYQNSLTLILDPYWSSKDISGIKEQILELTAPAKYTQLHFDLVVAFELLEQGRKDSDQSKIEQGIDELNSIVAKNPWIRNQ